MTVMREVLPARGVADAPFLSSLPSEFTEPLRALLPLPLFGVFERSFEPLVFVLFCVTKGSGGAGLCASDIEYERLFDMTR